MIYVCCPIVQWPVWSFQYKKGWKLQWCIDLQKLNVNTIKDSYGLPRIEDTWLLKCCHMIYCARPQVRILASWDGWSIQSINSIHCQSTWILQVWLYAFGLKIVPATFHRLMKICLGKLQLNWCLIHLDDIIAPKLQRNILSDWGQFYKSSKK